MTTNNQDDGTDEREQSPDPFAPGELRRHLALNKAVDIYSWGRQEDGPTVDVGSLLADAAKIEEYFLYGLTEEIITISRVEE